MKIRHYIIPIFVPHLGCPHDCVFCNQKKIARAVTDISAQDVEETIEDYLKTFTKGKKYIELAFYGGSFTGILAEKQEELLSVPYKYKKAGLIDAIRLSTRPDYINPEILDRLKKYSVDTIELGVQSLDEEVLFLSGRGHSIEDVDRACQLIREYDFNLGLQMMLGLPGDTRIKAIDTAEKILAYKPDCIRIYPTLVIKETYLEEMYRSGSYEDLSLEEAVDLSSDILMLFTYHNLNVIRVGLQPTENIQLGKDVIAGPFHPAFRQLVESNILKKLLNEFFHDNRIEEIDLLEVYISNSQVSDFSGQKSSNINYFRENYKIKKIKVFGDTSNSAKIRFVFKGRELIFDKGKYMYKYLKEKDLVKRC